MKKERYKILLLADLKSSTQNTIRNTISLARVLDADIELFHVSKPTELVEQENQLATMRTLNRRHVSTSRKIRELLDKVSAGHEVNINASFSFGNVKAEIEKQIYKHKPDIVVLGKRKRKPLNISGDNVTDFLIKTFKGSILISSNKNILDPVKGLSLGLVNDSVNPFKMNFAQELLEHSKTPLRVFKIAEGTGNVKSHRNHAEDNMVEFIFDRNDNSIKNLTKYLQKSDVNLAYLNREKLGTNSRVKSMMDIIGKIEIPILLSGEQEKVMS